MKRARAKNILVNTCCACKMPFDNNMVACDVCGIITNVLIFAPHQTPLFVRKVNLFSFALCGGLHHV